MNTRRPASGRAATATARAISNQPTITVVAADRPIVA